MKAISTEDVSLDVLSELASDLSPEIELEVDRNQTLFRSFEPPSWVVVLDQCEFWVKLLAALYGAEFVKELAKDNYKRREEIFTILKSLGAAGIRKLAAYIVKIRERLSDRTRIRIGIPIPSEAFPSTVEVLGLTLEDVELEIKVFALHQPAISSLIKTEGLDRGRICGTLQFVTLDNGSLQVSWRDADMNAMTRVLPLVLPRPGA